MWTRDLVSQVRKQLPRWRWRSTLRQRGGGLEGRSQKDSIRFGVTCLRGIWITTVWRLAKRKLAKRKWISFDTIEVRSLEELVSLIQESCGA